MSNATSDRTDAEINRLQDAENSRVRRMLKLSKLFFELSEMVIVIAAFGAAAELTDSTLLRSWSQFLGAAFAMVVSYQVLSSDILRSLDLKRRRWQMRLQIPMAAIMGLSAAAVGFAASSYAREAAQTMRSQTQIQPASKQDCSFAAKSIERTSTALSASNRVPAAKNSH